MIPDWAKSVESSIEKYKEVSDLIKDGFHGMASMELKNAYFLLNMIAQELGMTGFSDFPSTSSLYRQDFSY